MVRDQLLEFEEETFNVSAEKSMSHAILSSTMAVAGLHFILFRFYRAPLREYGFAYTMSNGCYCNLLGFIEFIFNFHSYFQKNSLLFWYKKNSIILENLLYFNMLNCFLDSCDLWFWWIIIDIYFRYVQRKNVNRFESKTILLCWRIESDSSIMVFIIQK